MALDDAFAKVLLDWGPPKYGPKIEYYEILRDGEPINGIHVVPPEHSWSDTYDGAAHKYQVRAVAVNGLTSLSDSQSTISTPP